jgi:hypothetical protein
VVEEVLIGFLQQNLIHVRHPALPEKKPEASTPEREYNPDKVAIQDGYHDKDTL